MKRLIYLILFIPILAFSQAQSPVTPETPHTLIFREVFNDEYSVIRNGGTVTDVTFDDGNVVNSSGYINYPRTKLPAAFSIRAIFNVSDLSSAGSIIADDYSSGKYFRIRLETDGSFKIFSDANGSRTSTAGDIVEGIRNEIVVTNDGAGSDNINFYINGESSNSPQSFAGTFQYFQQLLADGNEVSPLKGTCDLIEIYNYALSASEVSNLYNNRRFTELNIPSTFSLTAERGLIEEKYGASFTNTNVEVVKDGSNWVIDFGNTYLTFSSSYNLGTNYTISFWAKLDGDALITHNIIQSNDNDNYVSLRLDNDRIYHLTNARSSYANYTLDNKWHFYSIIRVGTDVNFYVDGVYISDYTLSSNDDYQFKYIGNRDGDDFDFYGLANNINTWNQALTAEQVSQLYTSTKFKYGK